jgi:hypothetical protein
VRTQPAHCKKRRAQRTQPAAAATTAMRKPPAQTAHRSRTAHRTPQMQVLLNDRHTQAGSAEHTVILSFKISILVITDDVIICVEINEAVIF